LLLSCTNKIKVKLTIIIPAHNEEESLPFTLENLEKKLQLEHKVIIVNDHSRDNTSKVVEDFSKKYPNITVVANDGEPGFANAIKKGFSQVQEGLALLMMADNCDDPETIGPMYDKINQGYDIVCGSRYMKGGKREGRPIQGFFSKSVGLILCHLIKIPTHDSSNAFKMYRKEVLDSIVIEEAGFASSLEITVKAFIKGFKITEVPTKWRKREAGKSKFQINSVARNYIYWFFWTLFHACLKRKNA